MKDLSILNLEKRPVGTKFKCIKTTEDKSYIENKIYRSDYPLCITDEQGNLSHCWESKDINKYFKILDDNIKNSKIEHPSHYTWLKEKCGIEVIDITRHLDFDKGNSIKYILRSGYKSEEGYTDKQKEIEDLKKAIFYLKDKIKMLENE